VSHYTTFASEMQGVVDNMGKIQKLLK
jgi:hypothetical protein